MTEEFSLKIFWYIEPFSKFNSIDDSVSRYFSLDARTKEDLSSLPSKTITLSKEFFSLSSIYIKLPLSSKNISSLGLIDASFS